MGKYKILYSKDAVNDLDSIFDYISEDNRNAAIKLLERIENSILKLADNPRMGTVLLINDLSIIEPGYRKIIVMPYIIFYRIGKSQIYISRVLHSKQYWMSLLFEKDF